MADALVIGATGFLGSALSARLRAEGHRVIGASRSARGPDTIALDLGAPAQWPQLPVVDVSFLCAGPAGLAACEQAPQTTRRVNVEGVIAAAGRLSAAGSFVVLVSTSHVFDGATPAAAATAAPTPVNEYGAQKRDAEVAVLALERGAVLRLSKVIGPGDARAAAWRQALASGQPIEAFDDFAIAPIALADAVDALIDVGRSGRSGIFQLSGERDESFYAFALACASHLNVGNTLVRRVSAEAAGVPSVFRPRHATLEQTLPHALRPAGIEELAALALSPRAGPRGAG